MMPVRTGSLHLSSGGYLVFPGRVCDIRQQKIGLKEQSPLHQRQRNVFVQEGLHLPCFKRPVFALCAGVLLLCNIKGSPIPLSFNGLNFYSELGHPVFPPTSKFGWCSHGQLLQGSSSPHTQV